MPDNASGPGSPGAKRVILGSLPLIFTVGRFLIDVVGRAGRRQGLAMAKAISTQVAKITRGTVRRNMRTFFQPLGWGEEAIERTFRAHQEYMARLRYECAAILAAPRERVSNHVVIEGEDLLRRASTGGKGVMLVGTHFGTWWHAPATLAARGYSTWSIFNSFPLYSLERYLRQKGARVGIHLSIVGKGAREAVVAACRENKVVYVTFDMAPDPREKHWIPFGPARINMNPGPAILAARQEVPILYALCEQMPGIGTKIRILPIAEPGRIRPSQLYREWASLLLSEVLRKPEQWWAWGFIDLRPTLTPTEAPSLASVNARLGDALHRSRAASAS
jgi:lauroyl/myristoyl acyltransferase